MKILQKKLFVLSCGLGICLSSCATLLIPGVIASNTTPMYEKYEISFPITGSTYTNPYDPGQINVYAVFTAPSGKQYTQNAFFNEEVTSSTNSYTLDPCGDTYFGTAPFDKYETVSLTGVKQWKIRFSTNEIGNWKFRIYANEPISGATTAYPSPTTYDTFTSTTALSSNHGFVSAANYRYLKFSDGTPYYPIGNSYPFFQGPNCGKYDCGTNEMLQVMNEMANQGINFFRIFVNCPEGINLIGKDVGQPSGKTYLRYFNQTNAWQLDQVVNYAQSRGIHLEFALINTLMFANSYEGITSCHWSHTNPFNAHPTYTPNWANSGDYSGTCTYGIDFITNPDAVNVTKNLFRYIVARWSYSSSLMSYELIDEWEGIKNTMSGVPPNTNADPCTGAALPTWSSYQTDLTNWHTTMKNYISSIDPFKHLVTAAAANMYDPCSTGIFQNMDFTQTHSYMDYNNYNLTNDAQDALYNVTRTYQTQFPGKPYMTGETFYFADGNHYGSTYMQANDPKFYDLHCILWATMFNGSMAPASFWDNIFLYKNNVLSHYKGISEYSKLLPQLSERYDAIKTTDPTTGLRLFYLENVNSDKIYGWVQDKNFSMANIWGTVSSHPYRPYLLNPASNRPQLFSTTNDITFNVLKTGIYDVRWFNTQTGLLYSTATATTNSSNQIKVTMPQALRDGTYADAGFMIEYKCANHWNTGILNNTAPGNVKQYSPLVVNSNQVNYIATDNKIHAMYWTGYFWQEAILSTSAPANVRMDSDLGINQSGSVFFVGTDNRVHIYYNTGTYWQEATLNLSAPADVRANSAIAVDPQGKVYYVGMDDRIHTYYWNGSLWANQTLNSSAPANVALKSDLAVDTHNRVFFVGKDWRIHKMELIAGVWQESVLNSGQAQNVRNISGSSNSSLANDPASNNAIFFIGTDDRVHIIYLYNNIWNETVLNSAALPNVRNASSDCQNMLSVDQNNYIYFVANDNRIHQYYWDSSLGYWQETGNSGNDPQNVWGGITTDVTPSYLYFVGNNNRIWSSYWGCQSLFRSIEIPDSTLTERENNKESEIIVYPNPTVGIINIAGLKQGYTINIFDIIGTKVMTTITQEETAIINCSSLKSGIYFVQVVDGNNAINKKIVIER